MRNIQKPIIIALFSLILFAACLNGVAAQGEVQNQKTSITATKVWSLGGILERPRIWFKLYRQAGPDGPVQEVPTAEAPVKEVPAAAATPIATQTVTWDNLDTHSPGNIQYIYSVKETDQNGIPMNPAKFLKVEYGLTVLNKYAPGPYYHVLARKYWHNLKDTDQRPTYTLVLKQNDILMAGKQQIMIPPAYIYMWSPVDLYETGSTPYRYSVDEQPVPNGYDLTVKMGFQTIQTAGGDMIFPDPHTWEIHNEYTGGPKKSVTGTKVWQGGSKPNVWFKLQRETAKIPIQDVPDDELKLISAVNLTATWDNLPTYATTSEAYIYSIIETDAHGNPLTLPNYDMTISEDRLTITNTDNTQGKIRVKIITYPGAGDPTRFSFETSGVGWVPFDLSAADQPNEQSVKGGMYAITQTHNPTMPLLDSFCESSIMNKSQQPDRIELADGETVSCTFINVPPNSIAVKKLTAGITDETFEFEGALAGKIKNGGYLVKTDADPDGSLWEVKEAAKNGWKLDSITCKETNAANSELLTEVQIDRNRVMFGLDQGEVILCTFINKQFIELPSTGFPVESSVSPQQ